MITSINICLNLLRSCVIEDVVTTGGQILLSAKDLCDLGANVKHVLCVIERIYGFTRSRNYQDGVSFYHFGTGEKAIPQQAGIILQIMFRILNQ
jgi:orotate phosphoribosyltransferase